MSNMAHQGRNMQFIEKTVLLLNKLQFDRVLNTLNSPLHYSFNITQTPTHIIHSVCPFITL
jgi:hypothetical protein